MTRQTPVRRLPLLMGTLAGFAAGVLGGWWAGSQYGFSGQSSPTASAPLRPLEGRSVPAAALVPPPAVQSAAAAAILAIKESPATDASSAAAQIARALRTSNPIDRSLQFHRILELITPENGRFYYEGWRLYLSQNSGEIGEGALFNRRIGQVLGPFAVGTRTGDTFSDSGGTRSWVRDQFLGWMDTDPAAARTWLDGLKNEEFREAMIGSWFEATSESNLPAAVAMLRSLPEDLQNRYARQMVATMRQTKGPEEVGTWLSGMAAEGDTTRNAPWLHTACDALMELLTDTRTTGEATARLFEQHSGQPYANPSWGLTIAKRFAASDPSRALSWALQMHARPEYSGDSAILHAAADGIPANKLTTAAADFDPSPPGPARDLVLARIATRLQPSDPAAAASIAARISDPALRPVPAPAGTP